MIRPEPTLRALSPRPSAFNVDSMLDDDMKTARRRAERAITEDGFLDIRNIKFPKPETFDDEVSKRACLLFGYLPTWALELRLVADNYLGIKCERTFNPLLLVSFPTENDAFELN